MSEPETGGPPPWPAGAAWVDGRYRPIEDARISVLDLGVTRSDCTYDVVHVWQGRFYRLDAHLDRFAASMARLRLDPGQDRAGIEAILHGCVSHAGLRDAFVSMTCTRGRIPPGSRDLRAARSNFYCYAVPFVWISRPEQQETGTRLWISDLTRIPPQSVDPTVKNYHWLDLDLALLDAYDHDADQVVLRDLSGAITEGPGYNVFAHVNGRWLTPGHGTLAGITRRSLIELAREAGQRVDEGCLTADDLLRADEVLVTSTAGGIMPVTVVNGAPVGTGVPGPLTRDLKDRYWASHQDPRYSTPVRYEEPARGPGLLPGSGGWSVAVQDLGLVLVPGGGGAVGVDDQGPAALVDHHLVVEKAEHDAAGQAGGAAVGQVLDVVHLARRGGLAAAAGPFAVPAAEPGRSLRIPAGTVRA